MSKTLDLTTTPLLREGWEEELNKMILSHYAPKWNAKIGDKITEGDYQFVKSFEKELIHAKKNGYYQTKQSILSYIEDYRIQSEFFRSRLYGLKIKDEFESIPLTTRDDLQSHITEIIPSDIDLSKMVINPTSGTTGKPILAPNHPKAIGCYVPLIEYSVEKFGVKPIHSPKSSFAIQLCYQEKTIEYATCHSLAGGAKFAKINIHPNSWRRTSDIQNFLKESSPQILTGDPYAFESAMKMGIQYRPEAIHSTALELTPALREKLTEFFQCPVINFYSLNETGPIAYSCPIHPNWMHLLPHDLYLEVLSEESGFPVPTGNIGEFVITGGRNPYLPLLRYKTGDFGEIEFGPCLCGDHFPRLRLLSGRKPVYFQKTNGDTINPIDVGRILRKKPFIFQFQVEQTKRQEWECRISLESEIKNDEIYWEIEKNKLQKELEALFGENSNVLISTNFPLDGKKQLAYINSYQIQTEANG
ncbi:AMP-binding enzyme domain protein [Leptospira yanagawae serovar Saopaulo str. Sao Paulo = ATCC 700523]|uniref:AMP-binding enzyme domain protein n=1 Tax=Leptospira yanagawae serovar Saopaulo str. Sao Paulo = ATCC 700523 TaxID=1249483 RepID=A0A5E8HD35_9LEPT|nr:phenylacetate--CoA ligase family protein [Leptospira yanagawae]EOQ88628.1 AMP-binding enzyme domain protein [Leptospira yanagawae serovar Saopaulo str. Sao Paulo = ATCC 700523]